MQEQPIQNTPKVIKERNSKLQSLKRKVNKPVKDKSKGIGLADQDFLMYNSPEDEDYLRNVVKDNYSNTVQKTYNSSEY